MHCVGRYGFSLPAGFVESERSGVIYRVEVGPQAAAPEQALRAALKGRPILEEGVLGARIPSVWIEVRALRATRRQLLVAAPAGDHTLMLTATASAGRERVAEQLVRNILAAYRPGVARGFCIGPGSIVSEGSRNERAGLTLTSSVAPGLELRLSTETVVMPQPDHPFVQYAEMAPELARRGQQLKVLEHRPSRVAGVDGIDGRISLTDEDGRTTRRYLWFHAGAPARSEDPALSIHAEAPEALHDALDAAWTMVLQTFKRLPQDA